MERKYKVILSIVLLLLSAVAWGQSTVVSGVVSDENGVPLLGVSVVEDGTTNGVSTDQKGAYTIRLKGVNPVLSFHYIGYTSRKIEVNRRTTIDVVLVETTTTLNDVVVVGYGVQKKVNVTGAVTSIDFEKQMAGRAIVNPSTALSGLVAGMNVAQTSGQPGSDAATIRLRGTGTFSSSGNSPLVLVDGIEWSMNDINPNDIASVSVLKDAASTAIYGTRAANGVILITTKQGSKGRAQINYSYSGIVQMPYNNLEFVTDYARYMELVNESCENVSAVNIFSSHTIDTWQTAKADPYGYNEFGVPNSVAYPNTDWFDELFKTGYSQEHNLSVSGAGDKIKYLVSLGYLDNQGIMNRWDLDSSTQKINFRTNLEADVTKWFRIGTRILAQKQDYGLTNVSEGFKYLYMTTPGVYPGEPNYWGKPASDEESPQANNIFSHMSGRDGYRTTWRINGSLYAVLTPYKGLSFEGTFNYSPVFSSQSRYSTPNGTWNYVTDERVSQSDLATASITNQNSRNYRVSSELLARYNTTFADDHELGVLFGYSAIIFENNGTWGFTKQGATDWTLHEMSTYTELSGSNSTAADSWALRSYFGRINYAYKSRYLFEANLRADGSSRFGPNNRYGYFPSFSAGWRISEENFMENSRRWLSSLKLRASWGQTGNNSIGNYAWQATYDTSNVVVDGTPTTGLYISSMSNENLAWETTSTTDIGIDFGMFDNRFTGEVDYYSKSTTDILYTPPIYYTMGFVSGVPSNWGRMLNRGVEVTLNWNSNVGKNFSYRVGFNFSYNHNKVTRFKGRLQKYWTEDADGNLIFHNNLSDVTASYNSGLLCEGHMAGEYYIRRLYRGTGEGYTGGAVDIQAGPRDGMIRTSADLEWVQAMIDSGYSFNGTKIVSKDQLWYGDLIYADLNGDSNYGNDDDRDFTGYSAMPRYNLGLNLGFTWRSLDFGMVWSAALGFRLNWRAGTYNSSSVRYGHGLMEHIADDHYFFDPANPTDSRTNVNGKYPRLTYAYDGSNTQASDFYDYKGDYLKLRNVQVGYTLPERISRKFFVQKLRAYLSMDNILTITDYPGLDPEIGTTIGYPLMRQVSLGIQVTF